MPVAISASFQFVLVNVVVAVLMKHLEESNKKMSDAPSEGGGTTPGTDTEGNPKTDTEGEEKDTTEAEAVSVDTVSD